MTGTVSSKKDEIIRQHQITKRKTDREFLSNYLYDKGEVLYIAEDSVSYPHKNDSS